MLMVMSAWWKVEREELFAAALLPQVWCASEKGIAVEKAGYQLDARRQSAGVSANKSAGYPPGTADDLIFLAGDTDR